ncbi:M48 family metalloprotease [Pseudoflavitalea sp. X16]|uniref:M56 family metallopeptidase n=1 Tax=Paraflavitalea devenefica TaxID=2716334 RepID=UPI00141E6898|nr:M56 family metallopeptidase [Paraflavitalea devenefica]NII27660.1 M48 family metalloprotease [Paraflavitalea devenefica]
MNWLFVDGSIIRQGIQAFSWMLIHSLWQGLLLAILAGMVMLFTKKARAIVRYTIVTGLLVTFLAGCGFTFLYEWNHQQAAGTASSIAGAWASLTVLQDYGIHHWPAAFARFCSGNAMLIVISWFIVFSIKCWQMGRAFGYVRRIRTANHQQPGAYWENKIAALTQQLQIKRTVILLESGITKIPVVIGHLKPVIYMPLGLLAQLPPDQVEAVLLHELAHIRRNDYLINLFQNLAETVFFFNPGLLWVSSLIKQEREHCCDDIALGHTGNKKQFIQALISFKEHVLYGKNYAMAFPGRKNHLLQRVTRLIQNRNNSLSGGEKIFLVGSLFICFVLLATRPHIGPSAKQVVATTQERHSPAESFTTIKQSEEPVEKKTTTSSRKQKDNATLAENRQLVIKSVQETEALYDIHTHPIPYEQQVVMAPPQQEEQLTQAEKDRRQADRDREQHERDKQQADRDRQQAEKDRQQAEMDRLQAERDRQQADRDRQQADRDRQQAENDRQQAERDRIQADKDKAQAELDRRQAAQDRQQAERDRINAEKDRAAMNKRTS